MISLVYKLLQISTIGESSTPPQQLSRKFSPLQNRRLLCEAFGVRGGELNLFEDIDWSKFADEIRQSQIGAENNVKQRAFELMSKLNLVHQKDNLVS